MTSLIDGILATVVGGGFATVLFAAMLLMIVDTTVVVGLAVPGEVCVLTLAASVPPQRVPFVALGVAIGTLLGWSASYGVGKRLSRRLYGIRLGRWLGPQHWRHAEELLSGPSGRVLATVQFMPVLNALAPAVAGSLGMPYRRFVRLAAVGTGLWALFYSTLGAASKAIGPWLWHRHGAATGLLIIGLPAAGTAWVIAIRIVRRASASKSPPVRNSSAGTKA